MYAGQFKYVYTCDVMAALKSWEWPGDEAIGKQILSFMQLNAHHLWSLITELIDHIM